MSFVVYKSSAGSGKTYTLVKEFLKITLSSPESSRYRGILAITFTNKAANEMKERVLHALQAIAENAHSEGTVSFLFQDLTTELELEENELRKRAKGVLQHILHHYSDFAISTIDKFTYKIVRIFAQDLKIPMNFEVELEGDFFLKRAIDTLISKVGTDKTVTKALLEFIESKADDEASTDIRNNLLKFSKNLLDEEGVKHIDYLLTVSVEQLFEVKNKLQKAINEFDSELCNIGKEVLIKIKNDNLTASAFANGERGIVKYFEYLANKRYENYEPTSTALKTIEQNKWYAGKASESEKAAIDGLILFITDSFYKVQSILQEKNSTINLYRLAYENIYPIIVLTEIEKVLNEFRLEKNVMHISEFNKRIAKIIANEPMPFIYERFGEKYANFMIDEFQDTSVLQWQNLLPLVDNSLAEGNFNMLVGDGKQAIYRWRGGEASQFSELPSLKKSNDDSLLRQEREASLKRWYIEKKLTQNFRSKREVIEFNNFFFRSMVNANSTLESLTSIYGNLEQEFNPQNTGGYVRIEAIDKDLEEENENHRKILETIQQALDDGYALKDIAILCRTNKTASKIASFLLENNISVVSSESLLLESADVIRFAVSYLKYINNSEDKTVQLEIALFLLKNKYIEADIHEFLSKLITANSFKNLCKEYGFVLEADYTTGLPLYELVERIFNHFNLYTTYDPYITFFLDFVFKYTVSTDNTIIGLLDEWEAKKHKLSIITPEGIHAVSIMTIHKSKGLEFPVVIVPFLNWEVKNSKDNVWINSEDEILPKSMLIRLKKEIEKTNFSHLYANENESSLLDTFNVLYVAFTRPRERLYVFAKETTKNISKYFLPFLQNHEGWNSSLSVFEYGTAVKQVTAKLQTSINEQATNITFSNWRKKLKIALRANEYWDTETFDKEKEYGNKLHAILAKIDSEKDIEREVNAALLSGNIVADECENFVAKIKSLLQLPEIKSLFEVGSRNTKNEAEIITLSGESYRPDKVIFDNNSVVVLDYKTGKSRESHLHQLIKYKTLLQEMGYAKVHGYILYTKEEKVVTV